MTLEVVDVLGEICEELAFFLEKTYESMRRGVLVS